jgi:putative phosphotransacetylase
VRLEGAAGSVDLSEGAIIAARHLHVSPADIVKLGVSDGDRVSLVVGTGDRRATLQDVPVRAGDKHATELHLDVDEAMALQAKTGDKAILLGRGQWSASKVRENGRRLVTERDVSRLAAAGETLCYFGPYLVTPAARDRAKSLGIWRETR